MKKNEVIKLLEAIDGNLNIWVVTDHGQTPEKVFQVMTSYLMDGEKIPSEDGKDEEYDPDDINKIIISN